MDEEQPSATRVLAETILGRFASLRASLRERIQEVDRMSQREIIHAADDVNTIYRIATSQIESLKLRLTARYQHGTTCETSNLMAQVSAVDSCIGDMNQRIGELIRIASQSADISSQINKAADLIQELSSNIQRITSQKGVPDEGYSIGSSQGIAAPQGAFNEFCDSLLSTSATIQRLAGMLGILVPNLERKIIDVGNHTRTFSISLRKDIAFLAGEEEALRNDVVGALETSDLALGTIVKTSQSALSHMQFQDAISQGLMRLDAIAQENEVAFCREVGLEERIAGLAPVMHLELGGDKAVEQTNAGKVVLF